MHVGRRTGRAEGREPGGMIDHVTLQVSDVAVSRAFYEAVLAPLGIAPGPTDGAAVGFFGAEPGSFWIGPAQRADDREVHIASGAPTREAVRAFHAAAVRAGAEVLHAPRTFPEYHDAYYGAFVRDPDGHNIEAVCHQPEA
jgi:catechol 2,3-dioxygenase-like lactoylglutathione lyase family enzyme